MSQVPSSGVLGAINMASNSWSGWWGVALGVFVLGDLTFGCGETSNVLTSRGKPGGTGAAGNDVDGGAGAGGAGSGARGGGTAGGDGTGAGNGEGGAAGAGANGGGTAGDGTTINPADPYVAQIKQLSDSLCSLLGDYPCLVPEDQRLLKFGKAEQISVCSRELQVMEFEYSGNVCFAEWAQETNCLIGLHRQCPCDGNDCLLVRPGSNPNPCPAEEKALEACWNDSSQTVDVSGPGGKCHWDKTGNGSCAAFCDGDPAVYGDAQQGLHCDGSPDGAQVCYCEVNGVAISDGVPNAVLYPFYVDTCAEAGQALADGRCSKILNCCFTWMPVATGGAPSVQQCSCTSDPKRDGFDSCQAIATQGGGTVVDICPQYLKQGPGSFPTSP